MKILPVALIFLSALIFTSPLVAGELEDGIKAYDNGDYTTAFQKLEPLAEKGDAEAQYYLSRMYLLGRGVKKDLVRALMWNLIYTSNGSLSLANLRNASNWRNELVKKMSLEQIEEAYRLLAICTKSNYKNCFASTDYVTNLNEDETSSHQQNSTSPESDEDITKLEKKLKFFKESRGANYSESIYELTKILAEKGNLQQQYELALMYDKGYGHIGNGAYIVDSYYEGAVKWYTLAANRGHSNAQYRLATIYHYGWEPETSAETLKWTFHAAQGYKKAVKWYARLAKQGVKEAQYGLGDIYYRGGYGVEKDVKEAFKWLSSLANEGHSRSQYGLGKMYYEGNGIKKDYKTAVKWLTLAVDNSEAIDEIRDIRNLLGDIYYEGGYRIEKDYNSAIKWYEWWDEQEKWTILIHLPNFGYKLGRIYYEGGYGIKKDLVRSLMWITISITETKKDLTKFVDYHSQNYFHVGGSYDRHYSDYDCSKKLESLYDGYPPEKMRKLREEEDEMLKNCRRTENLKNNLLKEMSPQQIEQAERLIQDCRENDFKGC